MLYKANLEWHVIIRLMLSNIYVIAIIIISMHCVFLIAWVIISSATEVEGHF